MQGCTFEFSDLAAILEESEVMLLYTNWKGLTRWRRVRPVCVHFGWCLFHGSEPRLFLRVLDLEIQEGNPEREFDLRDIQKWEFV